MVLLAVYQTKHYLWMKKAEYSRGGYQRKFRFKLVHSAHRSQVLSDWSGSIKSVNNEDQMYLAQQKQQQPRNRTRLNNLVIQALEQNAVLQ